MYAVADVYGLPPSELVGRAQTKSTREARLCVYLICKRCTRLSLAEIGGAIDRDGSTVLNGALSAARLEKRDPYFAGVVAELTERFGANVETVTQ